MRQAPQAKLVLCSLLGLALAVSGDGPATVALDRATGGRVLADPWTTERKDR